jgi:hypothetical protein
MSENSISSFREAAQNLHRGKSAAYRDAWKRRGEQISIIANIARKVDRLDAVADGAPPTLDESILDTAVDLFVYVLKYKTFLADQDETIARSIFGQNQVARPYSDGVEGFELLLAQADLAPLDEESGQSIADSVQGVLQAFAQVEAAFAEPIAALPDRAQRATVLATAAINLIGALHRVTPERYDRFLRQQF